METKTKTFKDGSHIFEIIRRRDKTIFHSYQTHLLVVARPYGQCSFGNRCKVQITVNNIRLLAHASALTALKKNNTLLSAGSHAVLFMVNLIYLQYFSFNN